MAITLYADSGLFPWLARLAYKLHTQQSLVYHYTQAASKIIWTFMWWSGDRARLVKNWSAEQASTGHWIELIHKRPVRVKIPQLGL